MFPSFPESIRQRGCVIPNHTTYYLNPQDSFNIIYYYTINIVVFLHSKFPIRWWRKNRQRWRRSAWTLRIVLVMSSMLNCANSHTQVRIYGFERINGQNKLKWIIHQLLFLYNIDENDDQRDKRETSGEGKEGVGCYGEGSIGVLSLSLSLCAVDGSENRPANWGRWLCALVQWEAFANFFSSSIALAVIGSPHFGPHTYTPPPPLKYKGIRNEVKTEINSPNTHTHTQQSLGGYVPCACSTFLSIPPPFFQLYPFGKKKHILN